MHCRSCGENNPEEGNFCGNCGRPLRPSLRSAPLSSRPRLRGKGIRPALALLFFLSLWAYLFYFIVEVKTFEPAGPAQPSFKEKINFFKEGSKDKAINFSLVFTSQEIDGYLNEELLKKSGAGITAIHTTFTPGEMEVGLSSNFLRLPTVFRIRARPVESGGDTKLIISGLSLGRLPVPVFFYPLLYRFYPWLNFNYWLERSGLKFKEIKLEKGLISLKGVCPL